MLGTLRTLELERLIDRRPCRQRDLVVAMICRPPAGAGLEAGHQPLAGTQTHARVDALGVADADEDELYGAMDWLLDAPGRASSGASRSGTSAPGGLVLYDLTSSVVEGRCCPLAKRGYSRDGQPGTRQIEYGLVTDAAGRPVAVEVVPGDTADPATVPALIEKLRERFELAEVVLVGDRGMLTTCPHRGLARGGPGLDQLAAGPGHPRSSPRAGTLQLGLFDERGLAEISDPA